MPLCVGKATNPRKPMVAGESVCMRKMTCVAKPVACNLASAGAVRHQVASVRTSPCTGGDEKHRRHDTHAVAPSTLMHLITRIKPPIAVRASPPPTCSSPPSST